MLSIEFYIFSAMPGQAKKIVERMKADKNINYDEDWKVITLFVGGNDLCDFCGSGKVKVNQRFRVSFY
jgi:hypothetical protein